MGTIGFGWYEIIDSRGHWKVSHPQIGLCLDTLWDSLFSWHLAPTGTLVVTNEIQTTYAVHSQYGALIWYYKMKKTWKYLLELKVSPLCRTDSNLDICFDSQNAAQQDQWGTTTSPDWDINKMIQSTGFCIHKIPETLHPGCLCGPCASIEPPQHTLEPSLWPHFSAKPPRCNRRAKHRCAHNSWEPWTSGLLNSQYDPTG